jgi:predicted nucleic acid-binding protein
MRKGIIIADSGPIFSLALIDKLDLLNELFEEIKIPKAVWIEITKNKTANYQKIFSFFQDKTCEVKGFNELTFIMDSGESESVVLYKELNADFLLIDDRKARKIAENLGLNCIGTIGLLAVSKEKKLIEELKPIFQTFLKNKRYYSIEILNTILLKYNETKLL